jgi:putative CRISPR-associated protein (TIGR02619 family)
MPAALFVTVGTSALTNEKIGGLARSLDLKWRARLAAYLDPARTEDQRRNFPDLEALKRDLVTAHSAFWEKGRADPKFVLDPSNFQRSSAELTSTACLTRLRAAQEPETALEKIVLIQTGTASGQLAGDVVYEVMRSEAYASWRQVPTTSVARATIAVNWPQYGAVTQRLRELIQDARGHRTAIINITGSLKGIAAAIGILTNKEQYVLYYQHEVWETPVIVEPTGRTSERFGVI